LEPWPNHRNLGFLTPLWFHSTKNLPNIWINSNSTGLRDVFGYDGPSFRAIEVGHFYVVNRTVYPVDMFVIQSNGKYLRVVGQVGFLGINSHLQRWMLGQGLRLRDRNTRLEPRWGTQKLSASFLLNQGSFISQRSLGGPKDRGKIFPL